MLFTIIIVKMWQENFTESDNHVINVDVKMAKQTAKPNCLQQHPETHKSFGREPKSSTTVEYDSLPSSNAGHRPVICQHSLLVILQVIVSAVFAVHGPIIWNGMPRDLWSTDVGDHYWQYADSLRNVPAHTLKQSSTFAARAIIWAI